MSRHTRSLAGAAGLLVTCALLAPGAHAIPAKKPPAHKGRADSGVAYLAITRSHSVLLEYAAGENYDRLLGDGASTYLIKATIDKTGIHLIVKPVVFYTADGSLAGTATGSATVHASGETVKGRLSLTKGRGGEKRHSFTGTFTAQSDPTFKFLTLHYTGTYR